MTYAEARKKEVRRGYVGRLNNLIGRYRPGQPTVILLPGGMGSQLDQSTKPYHDGDPLPLNPYDTIWMDKGISPIFTRDILKIEVKMDDRDWRNKMVVPNGPLRFITEPYDGTKRFLRDHNANQIIFGYDWRRPVQESADHLKFFLQTFEKLVKEKYGQGAQPLRETTLLCHSLGGLVAKCFLNKVFTQTSGMVDVGKWMKQMITVATPFYGTSGHMSRYYVGQTLLNELYSIPVISKLVGTLPGPYILMFPDLALYNRDADGLNQTKYPLSRYPVVDTKTRDIADPFDPAMLKRFPQVVRNRKVYLDEAKKLKRSITQPLHPKVMEKIFHIRSPLVKTREILRWDNINGSTYDPVADGSPIRGPKGHGDGTVPAWAARLIHTPHDNIFNLKKARDHGDLMEHEETLKVVWKIITTGIMPKTIRCKNRLLCKRKTSREKARKFLKGIKKSTWHKHVESADEATCRRLFEEMALC